MVIETRKPEETYELGRKMGREAEPGQIVCLSGDLGVGKTVFTQGFAAGLRIEDESIRNREFIPGGQRGPGDR